MKSCLSLLGLVALPWLATQAAELHVDPRGNDAGRGTKAAPFKTIQRAANLAQPGDTITVHEGVYRERINPPRGGSSDSQRIVYQAPMGELVEIKGSEVIQGWALAQPGVWKVTLPNSYFGSFNPYQDRIRGDWFDRRGRDHHTGAVYLNGEWLTEAASLEEVLLPDGAKPAWVKGPKQQYLLNYLLNLAWLQPGNNTGSSGRIPAAQFTEQSGVAIAPRSDGGECLGWIEAGDWVKYERVDFGKRTEHVEIRASSATAGGVIELRLGSPTGELLGSCTVAHTGDWETWASFEAAIKPTSGVKPLCLVFKGRSGGGAPNPAINPNLWFAQVDDKQTTIWAQFPSVNPNEELVEINVRQTIFYPDQPGRNFITVRGFTMRHAATPWAPPTAEQIGLIGTHWSKGWIIENNVISHSVCSGVALGKHGDQFDNTSADTAEGYVKTIERAHAHAIPWNKENIGHHVVRNNRISHCEQTGIVGSLGSAFCTVTDNVIHDIHVRRLFSGAEMGGIKFHGAIDTVIARNRIFRTCRGLWLDWMTQGTRVSRNLFHDNLSEDLFVEVNHGPFLVDNNLFLSPVSILDMSEGAAYVHNLFAGRITNRPEPSRDTPYHPAHSTTVAGLVKTTGGDNRFFNNLFVGDGQALTPEKKGNLRELRWISGYGLWGYDGREFPLLTGGNVYYRHAEPSARESNALVRPDHDPGLRLIEDEQGAKLFITLGNDLRSAKTAPVSSAVLGEARVSKQPYTNADGTPLVMDVDYFGKARSSSAPTAGPFEAPAAGPTTMRIWIW